MSEKGWKGNKRLFSGVAAIILMGVSAVGFTTGLSFSGEWGWLIAPSTWLALTIIQFIGNDTDNHMDWVFSAGWIFTYILGIGASTWAMYTWINIPNDFMRWIVSFGLGGTVEILPERLLVLFIRSAAQIIPALTMKDKPQATRFDDTPFGTPPQPFSTPSQKYSPKHKPQFSNMR
jgi:hypothetical protein